MFSCGALKIRIGFTYDFKSVVLRLNFDMKNVAIPTFPQFCYPLYGRIKVMERLQLRPGAGRKLVWTGLCSYFWRISPRHFFDTKDGLQVDSGVAIWDDLEDHEFALS